MEEGKAGRADVKPVAGVEPVLDGDPCNVCVGAIEAAQGHLSSPEEELGVPSREFRAVAYEEVIEPELGGSRRYREEWADREDEALARVEPS